MTLLQVTTLINAPIERCFDLSLSIDLHMRSTAATAERAIAGTTSGLIKLGESVTWEAKHFGILQQLSVRIEELNRPFFFSDKMLTGAFKSMRHEHYFETSAHGTLMMDKFNYEVPYGPAGQMFNWLILKGYMRRFLKVHLPMRDAAQ